MSSLAPAPPAAWEYKLDGRSYQQLRALGVQHGSGDEVVAHQVADGVGNVFRAPDPATGQLGGHACQPGLFHLLAQDIPGQSSQPHRGGGT